MSVFGSSRRAFGLFAVAILASGIAAADTIEVTGIGTGEGSFTTGDDFYIDENGTNTDIYFAGNIDISVTDTGTIPPTGYDRTSMCVQLFTDINMNTVYNSTVLLPSQVTVTPPTVASLEQIAWLVDNEDQNPTTISDVDAAGLQLAIWKIAEDGLYNGAANPFSSGTVQEGPDPSAMTQAVFGAAVTYLSAAIGQSSDLAFVYYNTESNGTVVQMLEGPEFSGGPQPAPECPTFMLAGVTLLALGRTVRRKLGSG